jgi:precorrin-6B methylase 2
MPQPGMGGAGFFGHGVWTMNRIWRRLSATVLGALLLCMATLTHADAGNLNERYTRVPAGADGIGKRYMGRDIAGVMGWQGAAWLEREEREREERTDLLVTALQLKPGMVVADIGAGTGYLARRMAPAVTPGGKVLAVDVQPEMVAMLQTTVRQSGLTQIQPLLGAEDDVKLPVSSVDLAVMVDVYHELAFPYEMLASIIRALKPGGQLVFVEYRAEDPQVPIKALHKMSEAQIKQEAAVHALVWDRTVGTLPWQHLVVFRKRN